jgi:hypothetical protein
MARDTEPTTDIERAVLEKLRTLPPEQQQQVLNYVEILQQASGVRDDTPRRPRQNLIGLGDHLGFDITAEEIDELRREMWSGVRRDDA